MKLVTFLRGDVPHIGAVVDGDTRIIDFTVADGNSRPEFRDMLAFIETGEPALEQARTWIASAPAGAQVPLQDVRLLSPIPRPPQIRDCLCFEQHLLNAFAILRKVKAEGTDDPTKALREFEEQGLFQIPDVWYQRPIYYKGNRMSVIGTGEDIRWPAYAEKMDYELEFGFFIGRGGRDIPRESAMAHIFGYAIFNDVSARDDQVIEMPGGLGPAKSKDFDTGNVIGPWIVTADEIDPYTLTMTARVNGEEWSRGSSSTMHWKFEDLIAHISKSETLYPGEFVASGTVGGGCGLELERYLQPGDVIELEVEGIGTLKNRIVKS